MTIAVVLSVLTLVLLGAFVLKPMIKSQDDLWFHVAQTHQNSQALRLKEQKAEVLVALKELDFDFEMNKLSREDYKILREKYEAYAVELMAKIEAESLEQSKRFDQLKELRKQYEVASK